MFQLKDKIEKVKTFEVGKHFCYNHSENGIICSNSFRVFNNTKGSIYLIDGMLFKQSNRGVLQVFDIEKKIKIYDNESEGYKVFINRTSTLVDGFSVYVNRVSNKEEESGLLNLDTKLFNKVDYILGRVLLDLKLNINWGSEGSSILVNSIENGALLWRFSEFDKFNDVRGEQVNERVSNLLGEFNDVLWFSLSSGRQIGLDISLGKLKYQIGIHESSLPTFPYIIKEGDYIPFGEKTQLDTQQGEIIGLRDNYFIKVDLKETPLKREYIDVSQSMKAHHMSASYRRFSYPIDKNHIYFCDDRAGKIGVFDRNKKEVVWSYDLEMEREGIAQILEMKYSEGYWYVLDRNDTLHIFEKV